MNAIDQPTGARVPAENVAARVPAKNVAMGDDVEPDPADNVAVRGGIESDPALTLPNPVHQTRYGQWSRSHACTAKNMVCCRLPRKFFTPPWTF